MDYSYTCVFINIPFIMRFSLSFSLIFFLNIVNIWSQEDYEYLGVIQLNDSSFISYKIAFNEENGLYSNVWLSGPATYVFKGTI